MIQQGQTQNTCHPQQGLLLSAEADYIWQYDQNGKAILFYLARAVRNHRGIGCLLCHFNGIQGFSQRIRSERQSDPVLICPALTATAKSAIKASSVSPER